MLATFTGEIDPVAGTITIESHPTLEGQALGGNFAVVPEATPGVTVANVGGAHQNATGKCTDGSGSNSTWATVQITSNYTTSVGPPLVTTILSNVYAEITALSNMATASCTSSPAIPGVTAANGGLWAYGDLAAGETNATPVDWAFKFVTGAPTTFRGRVVAFVVDIRNPALPALPFTSGANAQVMTGTPNYAVFLNTGANNVLVVNSAGTVAVSAALSGPARAVAASGDGSGVWVAEPTARKIAYVLLATGALAGEISTTFPWDVTPYFIAADPITGTAWFDDVGQGSDLYWYTPGSPAPTTGTVFGTGGNLGALLAVNRGGICQLYAGDTLNGHLWWMANCAAQTAPVEITTHPAECVYDPLNGGLVAGSGGAVWFIGARIGSTASLCKVDNGLVSKEIDVDLGATNHTLQDLAYGPDGNLWANLFDESFNLQFLRIWLGSPGYGTVTVASAVVNGGAIGLASGAGGLWLPIDDLTLLQVTP